MVARVGRYGIRATAGANHVVEVSVFNVDGVNTGAATDLVKVRRLAGEGTVIVGDVVVVLPAVEIVPERTSIEGVFAQPAFKRLV